MINDERGSALWPPGPCIAELGPRAPGASGVPTFAPRVASSHVTSAAVAVAVACVPASLSEGWLSGRMTTPKYHGVVLSQEFV